MTARARKAGVAQPVPTRQRVLIEAMRLFGEQGYSATTVAQIESAAGLKSGSGGRPAAAPLSRWLKGANRPAACAGLGCARSGSDERGVSLLGAPRRPRVASVGNRRKPVPRDPCRPRRCADDRSRRSFRAAGCQSEFVEGRLKFRQGTNRIPAWADPISAWIKVDVGNDTLEPLWTWMLDRSATRVT